MASPNFRTMMKELGQGKIVTPIIRSALSKPTFDGFDVPVEGWITRPYDGWFHPSTHSTWTPRQLYYYLTVGEKMFVENPTLLFVLSVTQGKFWHNFVQRLLLDNGLMLQDEVPILDPIHMRRGHTDGLLSNGEGFEFKTASERVIVKMKTLDLLMKNQPKYYAQTQDYLDVTGGEVMRYFIMQLSAPFDMAEFEVPADPEFQAAQRDKYREAIEAAAAGEPPAPCCAFGSSQSKTCPVRYQCPVGAK